MRLEFITERKIEKLSKDELFDFIKNRILDDKILILEKEFDHNDRIEFMERSLVEATTETSVGINWVRIPVESKMQGRLRSKNFTAYFNLFAPGTSVIHQMEDGHYTVKSFNGETIAEV